MRKFLFDYLVNPIETLHFYACKKPARAAMLVLVLVAMAHLTSFAWNQLWIAVMAWSISYLFVLIFTFFESIILDFAAQLMQRESQSLNLFYWLSLAWLPMLLKPVLGLLNAALAYRFEPFFSAMQLVLFSAVVVLQFLTVRYLYKMSFLRSMVIYIFPLLMVVFAFGFLFVVVGFSLFLFLKGLI